MKKAKLHFPWLQTAMAAGTIIVLLKSAHTGSIGFETVDNVAETLYLHTTLVIVFACTVVYELLQFRQRRKDFDQQVVGYEEQIAKLVHLKTRLQRKAQKHAGHADKLKQFITGKILEYIEYDEKFLHFKNIAAEVRHNGVICFDKVTSTLRAQLLNTAHPTEKAALNDALEKMIYLWDLLDLSTTDNVAMYVANKIYESEEQYFRLALTHTDSQQALTPAFSTRRAVIKGLQVFVPDRSPPLTEIIDRSRPIVHLDDVFHIALEDAGKLLGNDNYIALVVENLVNNALYYFNSRKYGNKYSRVAVTLRLNESDAELTVYGCGPPIDKVQGEQIYQLGFSTKKSKGNNGKGLGLYFVKQIVTGYEGDIHYDNILNADETFVLRIETTDGNTTSDIIRVTCDEDGKPLCQKNETDAPHAEIALRMDVAIRSIEVAVQSSRQTYTIDDLESTERRTFLDPANPLIPRWVLEAHSSLAHGKITFRPLDVRGVQFVLRFPTAESRLDAAGVEKRHEGGKSTTQPAELQAMTSFASLSHRGAA